jgi:tetratricopeptide (TPR) repeat protein
VAFIERCLAKDPANRYQDAGGMRDALRKVREALASGEYSLGGEAGTLADGVIDPSAPTVMAPGTVMAPHAAERAATSGAAALDLSRAATPAADTLKGNAKTLSGRSRTRMSPPAAAPMEEEARSRWPVYAGAGAVALMLVAGAVVALKDRGTPVPTPPPADATAQVGALKEALVGNQVELARVDLQNKDYKAAAGRAERALALDPSSAEARQVLEQAQRTAAELEAVALEARKAFDAGDTDHATRALARVLALDPRHPVAGELTAALNVHFRKQAEDARRMAEDSKRDAEPFRSAAPTGSHRRIAPGATRPPSCGKTSSRWPRRSSSSRVTGTSAPAAPRKRRSARPRPPRPGQRRRRRPRWSRATCLRRRSRCHP